MKLLGCTVSTHSKFTFAFAIIEQGYSRWEQFSDNNFSFKKMNNDVRINPPFSIPACLACYTKNS